MRLTLRTLLCYLDGILDPGDADELGLKVKESKFATDLVDKIRDVTRRPRLGAPNLESRGLGLDANTVAEYLDNTLAPERVPDFERVCLESDIHLAETAASHQVLTLVLGEPAEIDPILRQKMYRLGQMSDEERTAAFAGRHIEASEPETVPAPKSAALAEKYPLTTAPAADDKKTVSPRAKPAVPDYMKAGRGSRWWPTLVTLLLAFAMAGVALRAMGPFDASHPLCKLLLPGGEQVAMAPAPAAAPKELQESPAENPAAPIDPNAGGAGDKPAADTPAIVPAPTLPENPPVALIPAAPEAVKPDAPVSPAPSPVAPPPENPPAPAIGEPKPFPGPTVALNNPVVPLPLPPGKLDAPAANEPALVARFTSEDQLLGRYVAEKQEWARVLPRSALAAGTQLVSLPAFRPQVLLAPAVQLALEGNTYVQLEAPSADGSPRIRVASGRLLAWTVGQAGARVEIGLGRDPGTPSVTLTFGNADSACALEVRNYLAPGGNPELESAELAVQLFTTAGEITWEEAGAPPVRVEAGRVLSRVGVQAPTKSAAISPPDWLEGKHISDVDRRAARTLFAELPLDRPLGLTLKEKADDRRAEVRSLAARGLYGVDEFDHLSAALSDEQQRSSWSAHVDVLLDALARGSHAAARARVALERARPEDAAVLYRLLWGYSPADMAQGGKATELVDQLDHKQLDVRVLAFENLRRITGSTLAYRPEQLATSRKLPLVRWRDKLKLGQIVYRTPPSPLPLAAEDKPADEPAPTPPSAAALTPPADAAPLPLLPPDAATEVPK